MVFSAKKIVAAAAALACVGAAHAGVITRVIDFENVNTVNMAFPPLAVEGDEFYQSGFYMDPFANIGSAQPGDLVGALVDGSDISNTCVSFACPTNNSTMFYTNLNDGVIFIGALSGLPFNLLSFQAAFLGDQTGLFPTVPGRIIVQANNAAGNSLGAFAFNLSASGNFATTNVAAANLLRTSTSIYSMYIYAQTCNTAGSCSAFTNDRGQFGIDNIVLNEIPEPGTWGLAGLALAGVAVARRRRAV